MPGWGYREVRRREVCANILADCAQKVLLIAAFASFILVGATVLTSGYISMWAMLAVGLFNSIMWSNIFAMSIDGLGEYTNKASGILVMAPVGGAIFPLLQGHQKSNKPNSKLKSKLIIKL